MSLRFKVYMLKLFSYIHGQWSGKVGTVPVTLFVLSYDAH